MTVELKSVFVGSVALAAIFLSLGCGDTATSSDATDATLFESAPSSIDSSAAFGVVDQASSFGEGPPGGRRGQGPPEEALAACADTTVGETCSFTDPRGNSHEGTCTARPDDSDQVVCRPDDLPGRDRRDRDRQGPPEEALAACSGASSGDECSFEAPFGSVSGFCVMPPIGDALACRPSEPRR